MMPPVNYATNTVSMSPLLLLGGGLPKQCDHLNTAELLNLDLAARVCGARSDHHLDTR